ncbi:MAG: glycosyltransferase [Bacteroides sp.]|nr:glycosyltransferase [Bacteroides sp.]
MEQTKVDEIFSGERFVPGIKDTQLSMEHYQRYYSVLPLIEGRTVLDAACGEGYGTALMSVSASHVTGVDISSDAVLRAKRNYSDRDNIDFLEASVAELPLTDRSVDVVVSFETIEHVDENIQRQFLSEAARVLKEDGILIMSTPNKEIYSDRPGYRNEFHIKEFYRDEFLKFLHAKFSNVSLYDQFFEDVCIINGDTENALSTYYRPKEYVQEAKYFIAVAGNCDISGMKLSHVYVNHDHEYDMRMARILQLQNEVEERNSHLRKLDGEIAEHRRYIPQLESEIAEHRQYILQLKSDIAALSGEKAALAKENEALKVINTMELETNAKLKNELECLEDENIRLKDEEKRYQREQQTYQQELQENAQTIRNKEGHIELLLETEREYEREKKSRTYRMALVFRKISAFFLPPNSKRRFLAKMLVRGIRHPRLMLHMINPRRIRNFFVIARKEGMDSVNEHYRLVEEYETSMLYPFQTDELEVSEVSETPDKTLEDYGRLSFPRLEDPAVSIVIPVYNQFEYTYNCLESILKNSGDIPYEVIVADDRSTDLTKDLEKIAEGITVLHNRENLRFLLNCNNAAKQAKGKYILFLNNDTQVQPDWLAPLVSLIERDEKIGMVGSKLVYPDGRLQEAGGIIWGDGHAWNYGNGQNPEQPEFNYVKEADYISGAAIMIRADLWRKIGGFDERFAPSYCEDSDLAFEVRRHGYKVLYQPLSVVVHFEGRSNGTDIHSGLKQYQVINSDKLKEKWADEFAKQSQTESDLFHAKDRSQNKKTILVIDHYVPMFDKDAGSRTIWQYINMFIDKGYNVKFMGDNFYPHEPYTTALQQIGVEVLYGPWYAQNYRQWILDNKENIDFAFLNRPHITEKYIDLLKDETDIKCIYYGCDLHCMRIRREYELCHDPKLLAEARDWEKREFAIMRKTDVNYYPSCVEIEQIHKTDPSIQAKTFDIYVYDKFRENIPFDFSKREGIVFVGGFGHPPNEDAVLWFAEQVFPEIRRKCDIPFYVVGANPTEQVKKLDGNGIHVKGFVTDDELAELYDTCRMAVIPLRYGAGVKGKVIEALYYGIPMVTTSVGIEGISGAEQFVEIADTAELFARKTVDLYNNTEELSRTVRVYQNYVKEHCSVEAVWNHIKDDFTR